MFLPQFHNCKYNSEWWGEGFTEWENVKSASPLFPGHDQPRIPLHGYNLLDTKSEIERQSKLAQEHGIYGFSIYHYWYKGKRLLSTPIDIILENKNLPVRFSLCWANHSWTRSWKNRTGSLDVLIEQTYEESLPEMEKHWDYLSKAFIDGRYIEVNGKALFQIYAPENIPNIENFINGLKNYSKNKYNKDIHFSAMITSWRVNYNYLNLFDSVTFFQPTLALFSQENVFNKYSGHNNKINIRSIILNAPEWIKKISYLILDTLPQSHHKHSYDETWSHLIKQYTTSYDAALKKIFPMGFVNFGNTPRYKKRARIFNDYNANKFEIYFEILLRESKLRNEDFVFLNAWNEWGEGMYLEPDHSELDARLKIVKSLSQKFCT